MLISDPSWENHQALFTRAGFTVESYRYFDAAANGYVRGEGAGLVVLKPLSKALADGDSIYAVIRGTAANQDGRTNGITVPSGEAQKAGSSGLKSSIQREPTRATGPVPDGGAATGRAASSGSISSPARMAAGAAIRLAVSNCPAASGTTGAIMVA